MDPRHSHSHKSASGGRHLREVQLVRGASSRASLDLQVTFQGRLIKAISLEQIRLRVDGLQRIVQGHGGLLVHVEDGTTIWALGERGHRFSVTIPMVEALTGSQDPDAAGFLRTLEVCERKVMDWLAPQIEDSMGALQRELSGSERRQ